MNTYIKLCRKAYLISFGGISLALGAWWFMKIPEWLVFPYIMYDLSTLAFVIGKLSEKKWLLKKEI